jgi:hypothetical protein
MTSLPAEHLSQFPPDLRQTILQLKGQYAQDDQAMEQAVLAATREARLVERVPKLISSLRSAHHLSFRGAFKVAALVLGMHPRTIEKIYYNGRT